MSIKDTKEYAIEVAETALSGFDRQVRGDLQAPNGDDNVKMFTAKGGSAVTLDTNTTSAAVVFDPEASLRNGQLTVQVYERKSDASVHKTQSVNLGRPTTEFISAGVLSSGLKVFNSSGVDVIGGTQTAAVLTSIPRDVSTLTSTSVANACANHERDLASGVVSREDSTLTMAMTGHFGKAMALTRNNTLTNIVKRTWDDGIGTRRNTDDTRLTHKVDTDLAVGIASDANYPLTDAKILDDADAQGGDKVRIVDTARLSSANNPLTLATFNAEVDVFVTFNDTDLTNTGQGYFGRILGLDSAANVVASKDVTDRLEVTDGQKIDIRFSGSITSSTMPIARVVVAITHTSIAATDSLFVTDSHAMVSAYEETADISARAIHVCVFEGLNSAATLNINSTAVLTGVPDSTNVFISSTGASPDVYDTNMVEIFLRSITRVMPRAFTIDGHAAVEKVVSAMYLGEEVDVAFKAMSFKSVAEKLKELAAMAHARSKDVPRLLDSIDKVGSALALMPGPMGTAGSAMRGLAGMGR